MCHVDYTYRHRGFGRLLLKEDLGLDSEDKIEDEELENESVERVATK
jgi:hypothetical protein